MVIDQPWTVCSLQHLNITMILAGISHIFITYSEVWKTAYHWKIVILPAEVLHKSLFDVYERIRVSNNKNDIESFLCNDLQTTLFSIQLDETIW